MSQVLVRKFWLVLRYMPPKLRSYRSLQVGVTCFSVICLMYRYEKSVPNGRETKTLGILIALLSRLCRVTNLRAGEFDQPLLSFSMSSMKPAICDMLQIFYSSPGVGVNWRNKPQPQDLNTVDLILHVSATICQ
jgi:hypothetical protein